MLLPLLSGCTGSSGESGEIRDNIKGSGNVVTQQRQTGSDFTQVELATVGTLIIEQGEPTSLTMEGEDNILPLILSEQRDGRLVIDAANSSTFTSTSPLTYTLRAKTLSYIATNGAGSIQVGPLQVDDLTIVAANAGSIKLQDLAARTLTALLSNVGSISAAGKVDTLEVTLTNAGSYSGRQLQSRSAKVSSGNAGSATVNATESVNATIDNVGNVYYVDYVGSPSVTRSGEGMGRMVPLKPEISLSPCTIPGNVKAECGTYRVYEDRASRTGRTIGLRVAIVRAANTSARVPDPVIYLAGGPGGSAVDSATGIGAAFRSLNQHHDWLLVDQRGTGGSNMLVYPPVPPEVTKATSAEQVEQALKPFVEKALKELPGDLRFYTTPVAVDDIDEVAQALGYEQVNLYGGSYGATTVQYYLRQHGDHVRTAIMDGGTLLDIPIFELIAPNGQRALDLVFDRCEAEKACHEAYPNVREEMQEVYNRLAEQPAVLSDVTDPLTNEPLVLDKDTFGEIVRQLLLSAYAASTLPRMIHHAYEGDYSGVVQPYMQYATQAGEGSRLAMYTIIRCSEAWAKARPAEVARQGEGTYFLGGQMSVALQVNTVCKYLPKGVAPPNDGQRVKSDVPVLILTGDADPQDPPSNVAGAEMQLPNSLQVTVPGQGHGTIQYGCLYKVAQDLVDTGTTRGLDTGCVKDVPIPSFDIDK